MTSKYDPRKEIPGQDLGPGAFASAVIRPTTLVDRARDSVMLPPEDGLDFVEDPTENDKLLRKIEGGIQSTSLYDALLVEAAEELAYLKYSRQQTHLSKGNVASAAEKRLKGIKVVADLAAMTSKEMSDMAGNEGQIKFHSVNFQNIMS